MALIERRLLEPIMHELLKCNHCRIRLPGVRELIAHKRDVHGVRYPEPEETSVTRSQLRRSATSKNRIL